MRQPWGIWENDIESEGRLGIEGEEIEKHSGNWGRSRGVGEGHEVEIVENDIDSEGISGVERSILGILGRSRKVG